jgi:endoglycosylceramidase
VLNFLVAVLAVILQTITCALRGVLFVKPSPKKARFIYDLDDRILIHRGVNISNYAKHAPDNITWHGKEDFAQLKKWGFNLVRYTVFWSRIEPVRDQYNYEYLRQVWRHIDELRKLEIDVVLDFHQDIFNTQFGGNGFPDWTVDVGGHEFKGLKKPWALTYFDKAVRHCYKNFWKSKELQNKYIAAVMNTMRVFVGMNNLIGVDIMNEPFPGKLLWFERGPLKRFYDKIQTAISNERRTSGQMIRMFFEPSILTSAGTASFLNLNIGVPAVYFPHSYDKIGKNFGWVNKQVMTKSIEAKVIEAQRMQVPLYIGEFGKEPEAKGSRQYYDLFMSLCEKYHISWTYWSFDQSNHNDKYAFINENRGPLPHLKTLTRVYPQKIAGKDPVYKTEGCRFTLEFKRTHSDAPTEIYVPWHLNNVTITANGHSYPRPENNVFSYRSDSNEKQKIEITWE